MRWCSVLSTKQSLGDAVAEAAVGVARELGPRPDLLVAFVSEHHAEDFERVPDLLGAGLAPGLLLGSSAGGVIGGGREAEGCPALSLTAAVLPGVELRPFRLAADVPPPAALARDVGVAPARRPHFVLLADPFSFDAERFVAGMDEAFPGSTKIGGLASAGRQPGANALYLGADVHRAGLVGVALSGDVAVDTIVAQGCRPVGDPMFVTRSDRNVIAELDGRAPLEVLQELFAGASARDRELFGHSLFIGLVMNPTQQTYRQGDFLIRNVIGIDRDTKALAVGSLVQPGAIVQLHLRDAQTSAEDLESVLARHRDRPPAAGSLLFSCLGRGSHLYGRADHDTDAFRRHLGPVPLGGFFCNGEIGPVEGSTFLHGYTSSFGLFRPAG